MSFRRREILISAAAASAALATPSILRAQSRELIVGGPGSITTPAKEHLIPKFESKYNCKVLYEGSNSATNIQKLRAQKGRPQYSIVMLDDPFMITAHEEGLLEPITSQDVPNITRLPASAVHADGAWVSYQRGIGSLAYNKSSLPHGVDSWAALWQPGLTRRVALSSMSFSQGPMMLVVAAHMATKLPFPEAFKQIDAGFDQLARLKPNLLTIYNDTSQGVQALETGEASMSAVEVSTLILARQDAGAPVGFARPKEGAFIMPNSMALVKNNAAPELARAWMNEYLGDEFQYILADKFYVDPVVPTAPVPPGFSRAENLFALDWYVVRQNRAAWTEKWDRAIGRL